MEKRELGTTGRRVAPLGLGCMGMSWAYHESGRDDRESASAIDAAVGAGVTLFDTARVYGDGHNERLIGRALSGRPGVTIATKGGLIVDDLPTRAMHRDGTPTGIRRQIDESLRNLGRDSIDLYYLHRVDPAVALEETWGTLAEAVRAGKLRWLGLSEVSVSQARLAHGIHPVTAIQSELSLWTRDHLGVSPAEGEDAAGPSGSGAVPISGAAPVVEAAPASGAAPRVGPPDSPGNVVEWARENGAAFIPYAPLGRGFLTDTLRREDFEAGDYRTTNPRFTPEAFERNGAITRIVREIALERGATPAQVALAWALGLGPHVIPIPGTRRSAHLAENLAAAELSLTAQERARLDALPAAVGRRY